MMKPIAVTVHLLNERLEKWPTSHPVIVRKYFCYVSQGLIFTGKPEAHSSKSLTIMLC